MAAVAPRCALVAYHFPPLASAGSPRSVRLVEALSRRDIETVVVTPQHPARGGFPIGEDSSARSTEIRLSAHGRRYTLQDRQPRLHALAWRFAHPFVEDYASAWATRVASVELPKTVEVVVVSAPPFSAIPAAARLAERHGVPLMIDYRDPWTTAVIDRVPSRRAFVRNQRREADVLKQAAAVAVTSEIGRSQLLQLATGLRVEVVPNSATIEGPITPAPRTKHEVVLSYVGTAHGTEILRSGRRGYVPAPVDRSARSFAPLLQALESPDFTEPRSGQLRIRVLGSLPASTRSQIERHPHGWRFELLGHGSPADVQSIYRTSDALFLNQVAMVDRKMKLPHVPGKTYDYLRSGLPIVASLAPGATWDALEGRPGVAIADVDEPSSLARVLSSVSRHERAIERFETFDSGDRFAEILLDVIESEGV